jgi:hypothetical protein
MMKNVLVLLVSFFVFGLIATYCQTNTETKYAYCELVGTSKLMSTKVTVQVDYGEEKGAFQGNAKIKDEATGKVQAFNSMVDALNYMGNDGWEFVQAYTVTSGNINVYHWLLKKKVQ